MTDWLGTGAKSARTFGENIIAECIRRVKLAAKNDPNFVPPADDVSAILAARHFVTPVTLALPGPDDASLLLANRIYQHGVFGQSGSASSTTTASDLQAILAARVFLRGAISGGGSGSARLTAGTHLTGGPYNGTSNVTLATDATNVNTASTIVSRDASGNVAVSQATVKVVRATAGTDLELQDSAGNSSIVIADGGVDVSIPTGELSVTGNIFAGALIGPLVGSVTLPSTGGSALAGQLTLVLGAKTVATTEANTFANGRLIFFQRVTTGGTIGFATTYTVVAGTSFTVTSDSALDTSVYNWVILKVN